MRKPKLTYYLTWDGNGCYRYRTRRPVRLGFPLYKRGHYIGTVTGLGFEGNDFVVNLNA